MFCATETGIHIYEKSMQLINLHNQEQNYTLNTSVGSRDLNQYIIAFTLFLFRGPIWFLFGAAAMRVTPQKQNLKTKWETFLSHARTMYKSIGFC